MKKYVLFLFTLLSGFISTSQTLPAYLPSNGLVGWWPFNGNANDESGNGNDGTVNGAVLTSDRLGSANSAYDFNSLSSTITTSLIGPTVRSPRSVSLWFSLDLENTSNDQWVMMRYGGNSEFEGFTLSIWNTPNFGIAVDIGASYMVYGPSPIGSYHHLVATYDSTNGNTLQALKIYLDGMLLSDVIENNGVFTINTGDINPIRFGPGDSPISDLQTFKGKLDDIAIYNRALTQEEITSLYTGEPANPPTACNLLPSNLQNGLVGYWPFCGNANDESGNGNDGTVNGAILTEDRFGAANAAYNFDGIDDKIVSTLEAFSGQSMTLSCWYNTSDSQIEIEKALICSRNSYVETNGLFIYYFNGNPNYYFDRSICGGASTIITPIPSINSGNWIHYIGILDNDEMKLYENGQLISTSLNSSPFCINGKFVFGADTTFPNRFFNGSLDDIGIWNRALSADEVQELYTLNACTFTIYDTVTVNNYVTVYDTVSVSITDTLIINTLITAVQPAQENTFLVYPNPAHSQITIDNGNWSILGGYSIRIVNSAAQEVYNAPINQQTETIPLNGWGGNGLYVLYIIDPQQQIVAVKQIVLE